MAPAPADTDALARALIEGDRTALARAITLVESARADHRTQAAALIEAILPHTGQAVRIGLTGVPGVGKSTLIDRFGMDLIAMGRHVAVLTIDPSSGRTGGSILGDKTRMEHLARAENAFIRPSPTSGTLGGVALRTREVMLLAEAAGFDTIIVETVGVGQSEATVADMVDVLVALMLPGAGDELQGIKKGLLELTDILAINKADGDQEALARIASGNYRSALRILSGERDWAVPVLMVSGLTGKGMNDLWEAITGFIAHSQETGAFEKRRAEQAVLWFRTLLDDLIRRRLFAKDAMKAELAKAETAVRQGEKSAPLAAETILEGLGL